MTSTPLAVRPALLLGVPNQITLVRTVIAMALATYAFSTGDLLWLVIGYVAYWFGDSLDGWVARRRNEESLSGAVFDIVCDRACSFLLAAAFMATYPDTIGPLAIYLAQFGVLDTMLTFSFLLWPWMLSPNYFYKVDRPIYMWNWSKPAKAMNTGAVVVSLVVAGQTGADWLPYAVAIAALAVKIVSSYRLIQILCGRQAAAPGEPR
ncbi:CDP-diacylglycerol--glycerol-3-phosphate 3-phosphatidyltransferase [Kribbella sp. VKM Ac-2569]|uniref:CDP-alcohol phosphatidyltransferase family protein n=1 Tax=Kribbella sp. VKM Ac-2569 TaxID=2512220 RepID=UPI00102AF174|nr:CDP-alcohol phosphatidyltransferase family protein [Kribbella sp. VKM Ac-2569]RZT12691.1 CDP-diacylglycerol--glycerol-3-phosphate 3-phosphatidyltransferase [Kribbella sp. VKM Ac-2569]